MRTVLLQNYYDSDEYREKIQNRISVLKKCDEDPMEIARYALEDWSNSPISFIEQFGWVIIPEFNNEVKPFFLFDYQKKIITHIWECELSGEDHEILIDKPRGMGLTWLIVWYQIWRWLFTPNWGGFNISRTGDEVDRGDSDPNSSIFGKYRWGISYLPEWLKPEGFVPKGKKGTSTDMQLRIANPSIGSTLVGSTTNREVGRSRRYSICVTGDTMILTPNGFKEIKDIVDTCYPAVIGGDGKTYNIKKYLKLPKSPIYKIKLRGGIEIKGTSDHPLMTWDKDKKKDIGFKSLGDLKVGDDIKIYQGGYSFPLSYVPIDIDRFNQYKNERIVQQYTLKKDLSTPMILDERLAKFMGYLISEGCFQKNCSTITFVNTDKEVIDDFVKLTEELFNLKVRINYKEGTGKSIILGKLCNTKPCWTISLAGAHIRAVLHAYGCTFGSAWEKEIPTAIFNSPRSVISSFFSSLFEGDGSINIEIERKRNSRRKLRASYTTTSQKLARQIQSLMYLMGYYIHNKTYKDQREEHPTWHLLNRLNLFGMQAVDFCKEINIKKYKKFENEQFFVGKNSWYFQYQPVVKIDIIEPEETYDFEIDSEEHSFVSNMLISHNCFIDECFSIEHFLSVFRSLQSVSRTKIFVSTVKAGRVYKDFKDMCSKTGDYISLTWKDHPFKDQIWYEEQLKKAEFDPEIMKEVEVNYAISSKSQYYPQIKDAKIVNEMSYTRNKYPLFVSMDFGQQDLTALIWTFWDGASFNVLECMSNRRKPLEWYIPFLNPEITENPDHYLPHQLALIQRLRTFGKPRAYFGEAAHFQKIMPNNFSIADELNKKGIRLMSNNYAIGYEARQKATALLLPRTVFNFSSDGVTELYDAITNSRYAESNRGTSKESHLKVVHDPDISDFRSAFENGCTQFSRVLRLDRDINKKEVITNSSIQSMIKYLRI